MDNPKLRNAAVKFLQKEWHELSELEKRVEADGRQQPAPTRRWRMGLYSFDDPSAPAVAPPAAARKRTSKAPT